jgi:hypothetical protein
MKVHADKTAENKSQPVSNGFTARASGTAMQLKDNRPQYRAQKKQADALANNKNAQPLIQKKANNTGLPDQLKSGIEGLSGHSLDDVKVHYNSPPGTQLKNPCNGDLYP